MMCVALRRETAEAIETDIRATSTQCLLVLFPFAAKEQEGLVWA